MRSRVIACTPSELAERDARRLGVRVEPRRLLVRPSCLRKIAQLFHFACPKHPGVVREFWIVTNRLERLLQLAHGIFVAARLAENVPQPDASLPVLRFGTQRSSKEPFRELELSFGRFDSKAHSER